MIRRILILLATLCLFATAAIAGNLGQSSVELDGRKVASEETNLGNFVADAVRNASGAQIAILHAMAFRSNAQIDKGVAIDEQTFRNCLSAPTSKITTLKLTPAVLRRVMQRALAKYPDPNMGFLQLSGMEVTFDSSKPANTRITGIRVGGKQVDFADNTTLYTIAMPGELAKGAVGYLLEFNDDVLKTMQVSDLTVLDAISKEFARQKGEIAPEVEGRLKDSATKR